MTRGQFVPRWACLPVPILSPRSTKDGTGRNACPTRDGSPALGGIRTAAGGAWDRLNQTARWACRSLPELAPRHPSFVSLRALRGEIGDREHHEGREAHEATGRNRMMNDAGLRYFEAHFRTARRWCGAGPASAGHVKATGTVSTALRLLRIASLLIETCGTPP